MKKIIIAIPHSHTWFWTQTCISSLIRNPPKANGFECEIVVVDNSPWSPAIRGILDASLVCADGKRMCDSPSFLKSGFVDGFRVIDNHKSNKFHASALDCIVEKFDFDYLMAWETDVLALRPTWLQWFLVQMCVSDYAVGMWHHEQFINPSCTLYRGDVLRQMASWCKIEAPQEELRWGKDFELTAPLDNNLPKEENPASVLENLKSWIGGAFAEKRGFPQGTKIRPAPSGQEKGPGWYEPGQQLHHWAVNEGYTYTICPTVTVHKQPGLPVQTLYGGGSDQGREFAVPSAMSDRGETVHVWGGTRALDVLKHPVNCQFVAANTPFWLQREARFWLDSVPADVQKQTLELIRKYGWHYRGQGSDHVSERDREAAKFVNQQYTQGGVVI